MPIASREESSVFTPVFTETLQKQMVAVRFPEEVEEGSREWSTDLTSLPPEDQQRLELIDNYILE